MNFENVRLQLNAVAALSSLFARTPQTSKQLTAGPRRSELMEKIEPQEHHKSSKYFTLQQEVGYLVGWIFFSLRALF
jgi:hypothetical protein